MPAKLFLVFKIALIQISGQLLFLTEKTYALGWNFR